MPTVFVTAASGHIGTKLIPQLLEIRDIKLVLPTSNAARLISSIPKSDAIAVVEGSIQDPQWVETQLQSHNVDTVFLCLTGTDELFTTLNIFSALHRTPSMKHVIYLSACGNFSDPAIRPWRAAHCAVKGATEAGLRSLASESGLTYTIMGPTLFFGNDLRQKDSILKAGVYAEPVGEIGVSRVSENDIARAVTIAVLDQGKKWNGKKIMVGSGKKYTGSEIAALWNKALGKPVRSAPSNVASFDVLEGHIRQHIDPAWGRDLRLMFEEFGREGFGMSDEEYTEQLAYLGREPSSYEKFVETVAREWKI